jgi:antitoxin component YwqK of YwqJK toxin-antitoxin module
MDEKYLMEIYHNNGGQQRFGSYQAFYNKVQNDPEYRAKIHYLLIDTKKTDKSYSDWESSVKKKEPTGQNYGYGSNQTQQSSGSKPSQESDGFDKFKWIKDVAKQVEPPKKEVKSIMFKDQKPDVSKFGTQTFKSENELNSYIEELKKNQSDPEAQKQLINLLNNYESISSDIKSKGTYSFESLGVNTEKPVAKVTTATYTLEQINKGNYDPKRVDPNGRWEVKTVVIPESMEYDERTGKTVVKGGGTKQVKEWVPSSEFAQKLKEENKDWIQNTKEKIEHQGKILDAQRHVKEMSIFQDMGVQDFYKYDSELYNIEQDYQKGQIGSYEYEQKKSELEAKKAASLIGLENTYINALSKTDPEKAQEYRERYNEIMSDIKNAGFNSWDEYSRYLQQNGYNASNYIDGSDSEKDVFGIIDKPDQEFLRKIRSEAMQAYSSPFLDKMYASTNNVKRYIRDSQPILNDYDEFNNQVKQISDKYKSGNITAEQANAQLQALKNKETELKTRLQQVSDQYGVTQSDLERYSMKEMIGLSQYNNYNQFSGLKEFEQKSIVDQQNRQRWVSENPVLGSLAYALPNAWKHFTDMVLLETGKAAKPLAELVELGDGYGWTDRVFYGLETYQNDRDYLYGYSGQDIDGDGQIDDLPTVAKLIDVTSSGLGSVGAFAIPGSIAAKTFTGAGKLAAAGRFATNFGGAFLMMEAQAYQEALRAGLSQDDASEVATVTATLQSLAEQVVNDYSLVRANPFRSAGIISMYRAGLRGQKLMDEGLRYIAKSVKEINKQGLKEAGEEVLGQFGTDIGKDLGNAIYSQNDMVSYASGNGPADASVPFKDAWQIKPYYDNALAGYLTGGFMSAFKSAKPLSRTQMENLSYLGRNWKDVLQIIERTESNGINPGDDTYKQLERDLKGINSVVENLSVMPGFNELTKSNQDMIVSLAYRKKVIEDNMKQLGVELPNVKEELAGIDERINLYLTGKLDYGSNKAVQYNDDALMGMGVRNVMVNPDNSYEIEVRSDLNFDENQKQSISEKAKEYIENSLKNNDFRLTFLHPNTENYAIQESETGQVPVQPEAAVSEQVEEGAPKTEPQVSTEEGKQEEVVAPDVLTRTLDVVNQVEDKIGKSEPINDEDRKQAEDSLYELLNDIDSNPNLSQEQKAQMSLPIENRLQKIQDYELGTRTETRTTTQAVATGTTPKTQAKNERATIPLRTVAEESIDVTYNGRAGKLKIENGNYVFVPNKVGRQQPKPVVVGEAAVTNRDSKFAGVESVNKKGVTTSAQITLPNGAVLGIMDTDLSIDVGIEIAKQEVGPAPQSLFDVVFDEIVTENNVEIPYTKAAPKVEPVVTEEVQEEPKVDEAAENELGQQLLEANEYNNKRKNELLKKNKGDSRLRNLISSAATAIDAIKKIYPDFKVYLHENTEEYELATQAQGIKLSEAGAMIYDENGNIVGIHVDLSKADGTTTPHELVHGILAKAFGDNQVLFNEFKDRVSKLLSSSTNAQLQAFANRYGDDVKSEEYLVQLAALLTDQRGKIEPGILQKLMSLINNFVSRITKGNIVPFKSTAKTQALVDFFNTVSNTMATGRNVSGLQSDIQNLQRQFGVERAGSRMQERVQPNQAEETGAKEQFRDTIPIPEYDLEQYIANTVSAKQQISNNRREEYKKLLEKKRPDLVEQGLIDGVISQVEKFGEENSKDGKGNPKLEKLAFHYINNSNLILPEDGYKVIEAERLATKNKIDPFSYKNPLDIINQFQGTVKEKPINPDTIKEFSNKKTIPGTNITVYNVEDTREAQASVRRIIDTHFGDKSNPWCLAARTNGSLETAWGLWSGRYNKIPKKIAFENGKLIAFCASATNNDEWWDKQDNPHSGVPSTKKLEENKRQYVEYSEEGSIVNEGEVFRKTKNKEEYWYSNGQLKEEKNLKDGVLNGISKTYHENGMLEKEDNYDNGIRNGLSKRYYDSGQLQNELTWDQGKRKGAFKSYYENGILKEQTYYTNDDRNGQYFYYYDNGVIAEYGTYVDGELDGLSESYYRNGEIRESVKYDNGRRDGVFVRYYENGQLEERGEYNLSRRDGEYEEYYENGQLKQLANFDNGKLDGNYELYYENGQLREKSNIEFGEPNGVSLKYYENGQLQKKANYIDGKLYGILEEYYSNGKLKYKGDFVFDESEGVHETYYSNGQISKIENFVNGEPVLVESYYDNGQLEKKSNIENYEPVGLVEDYYENGQLRSERYYTNGKLNGTSKFYDENGMLESVVPWENDERNGTAKYYNEDGSLFAIKEYENDKLVFEDYPSNRISTTENQNEVLNRNRRAKQQIVGQRGVETANDKVAQKDLETAKLMASNNRPATDIKMATGWEMGADGQWRYEYPNVTLKDDLQDENDFRLVVKGYNQSQGISDRFNTKQPPIPLSEILNFGKIQEAYPYIDDLYFELDDSLQSEAYGQLDIGRGLVSLNPKIINDIGIDEVQKVLIHEIQHYIQEQEGFEKGGNVEMMEREIKQSQNAYKIPGLTLVGSTVEDTINYGVIDIKSMVESGISLNDIYNGNYDVSQYGNNPQALLKAVFRPDQIEKINDSDVDFAISKINEYALYSAAHKDYWSLVGETEARNAAKRSETPYLERLYGSTLESTEDVFRRDQIRKDGGRIFKEMDVISNKRGLARQRMEQQNRENFGELYVKAKEINDNFENIINQLGITKICGL